MDLYPQALAQLHHSLDAFANGVSMEELELPPSLNQAEQMADQILTEFLKSITNMDQYIKEVSEAATETAKKMYALRCFIAGNVIHAEPDKIEMFSNKPMTAKDFHEIDSMKQLSDGSTFIDEETDKDNPYKRALAHLSAKRQKIEEITCKTSISDRDLLPPEMGCRAEGILANYGLEVTKENAWKLLDTMSKEATIEERIIGRILYLITNSSTRSPDGKLLGVFLKPK